MDIQNINLRFRAGRAIFSEPPRVFRDRARVLDLLKRRGAAALLRAALAGGADLGPLARLLRVELRELRRDGLLEPPGEGPAE